MLYPTGPHIDMLRAEPFFKGAHITGSIQQAVAYPHQPARKHIGTLRIATQVELTIAVTAPAAPFVWISAPNEWHDRENYGNRQSVFITSRIHNRSEWKYFGEYQMVWAGYLEDNEFRRLPPHRQDVVLQRVLGYAVQGVAFARVMFERCFVIRPDGSQVNVLAAEEGERKERVRKALLDNDGTLKIIWFVMACRGVNQAEVDECRFKRGDPGAVNPFQPEEASGDKAKPRAARRSAAPSVEVKAKPNVQAALQPKDEEEEAPTPARRRKRSAAQTADVDVKPDIKPDAKSKRARIVNSEDLDAACEMD